MKISIYELIRKCQFPMMITFGGMPVIMILLSFVIPDVVPYAWILPFAYGILQTICLFTPGKWRLRSGIAGALILAGIGAWYCFMFFHVLILIFTALYIFVLFWGLQIAGWTEEEENFTFCHIFGFSAHIVGHILVIYRNILNDPIFDAAEPWMLWSFIIFAVVAMLSMNRNNLFSAAANGRQKIPHKMRWVNLVLTILLFVVALLIALMPSIVEAITSAWNWFVDALGDFLIWFVEDVLYQEQDPVYETTPGENQGSLGGNNSEGKVGFMEILMYISSPILVGASFLLILFALYRALRAMIPRIIESIKQHAATVSDDYIDEVTDTRDTDENNRTVSLKEKIQILSVNESKLSPDQRIRHRYLRLMLKHPEWSAGHTARQNLPDESARIYEKTRYSHHPVTEDDAAQFVSGTKQV